MKSIVFGILATMLVLSLNRSQAQTCSDPTPQMDHVQYKSFLQLFMDYPDKAMSQNKEGNVKIEFKADQAGRITQRKIVEGVSPNIDSTALAIFDLIQWKPGTYNSSYIASSGFFELDFNKKKFLRLAKKRDYLHVPQPYNPYDTSGTIYLVKKVEIAPHFFINKETTSLTEFIYSELKYPENASKLGISGQVKLKFIVEVNGLPSNITVEENVGGGCTEEGVRLLELTRWKPGMINNRYVRTIQEINIIFKKGESKDHHIPNQANSGI